VMKSIFEVRERGINLMEKAEGFGGYVQAEIAISSEDFAHNQNNRYYSVILRRFLETYTERADVYPSRTDLGCFSKCNINIGNIPALCRYNS
jgi:hypothetical protein